MRNENIGFVAGIMVGLFTFIIIILVGMIVSTTTGLIAREVPPYIGVAVIVVWSEASRRFAKALFPNDSSNS